MHLLFPLHRSQEFLGLRFDPRGRWYFCLPRRSSSGHQQGLPGRRRLYLGDRGRPHFAPALHIRRDRCCQPLRHCQSIHLELITYTDCVHRLLTRPLPTPSQPLSSSPALLTTLLFPSRPTPLSLSTPSPVRPRAFQRRVTSAETGATAVTGSPPSLPRSTHLHARARRSRSPLRRTFPQALTSLLSLA